MLVLLAVMAEQSADARKSLPPARCEELLAGIAQGDADAFAQLYRATDRMLYAYALSLTRSHHNAQDVMMETYLKIRAGAHLYRPMGKPLAWIFTIARNIAHSGQRTAAQEAPMEELPESASDDSGRREDALVLQEALHILSAEERQIVVLHAVSGLRHRELAEILKLPLSTVLSKYARALNKLKRHLTTQLREEEQLCGK